MSNEEIRIQIDKNNQLILEKMDTSTFILNNDVLLLLKENEELQAQCNHHFKNGICIYCDTMEEFYGN